MEVEKIKLTDINPAKYNPRKDLQPGDPEYEKLKKSMEAFGLVDPLVWNKRTGNLIGGHQRLKVLKEMGHNEAHVSVVDLDEQREKALNIALNKIGGDWDMPMLKDLIEELDAGDFDVELTGFDINEIEDLMTKSYEPADIDSLLQELNMEQAVDKPIWATIRTAAGNQEVLEQVLVALEVYGIRVERSYET